MTLSCDHLSISKNFKEERLTPKCEGWDCCHEISASNGEGVEEVFRVITRKLVEMKNKKHQEHLQDRNNKTWSQKRGQAGDFEGLSDVQGSFKLTNKRQSWLGMASASGIAVGEESDQGAQSLLGHSRGRCC